MHTPFSATYGLPIYTTADVVSFDRKNCTDNPSMALQWMRLAGQAAFDLLKELGESGYKILVGPGHNGGDGLVLATCALRESIAVSVYAPLGIGNDEVCQVVLAEFMAAGGVLVSEDAFANSRLPWIDALFGVGLNRPLPEPISLLIERLGAALLALDVPSGLNVESGEVVGDAVCALATVTFLGLKAGLFLGQGPRLAGRVFVTDLTQADGLTQSAKPIARLIRPRHLANLVTRADPMAHKGVGGSILVLGGQAPMLGASLLAARASLQARAGKVFWGVENSVVVPASLSEPELMVVGISDDGANTLEAVKHVDVLVVGPGLGQTSRAKNLLRVILTQVGDKAVVLDADALNNLAFDHSLPVPKTAGGCVITPHPLEANRLLLRFNPQAVASDRITQARVLATALNAYVVLKGAASIVAAPHGRVAIIDLGGPELAIPGSGDVLSGIIAACLASRVLGEDIFARVSLAVMLHALAGVQLSLQASGGHLVTTLSHALPRAYDWLIDWPNNCPSHTLKNNIQQRIRLLQVYQ